MFLVRAGGSVVPDMEHRLTFSILIQSAHGEPVIQLERAAGAAIQHFERACGVNVPRSRFLPVKDTSDLFIVQSNLYILQNGSLTSNPLRPFTSIPLVKLGDKFKSITQYDNRFKGKPEILVLTPIFLLFPFSSALF